MGEWCESIEMSETQDNKRQTYENQRSGVTTVQSFKNTLVQDVGQVELACNLIHRTSTLTKLKNALLTRTSRSFFSFDFHSDCFLSDTMSVQHVLHLSCIQHTRQLVSSHDTFLFSIVAERLSCFGGFIHSL
jgi:hypothetical protein